MTDTIAAQRALKVANSYIDDAIALDFSDPYAARSARTTLALAAKQLENAREADPDATITTDDGTLSRSVLRTTLLLQEALTWVSENPGNAISIAERATQLDPNAAPAFRLLGMLHLDARHTNQAVAALTRCLELDPDDIDALKALDRAKNMGGFETATYRATKIANTKVGGFNVFGLLLKPVLFLFIFPFKIVGWMLRHALKNG